MKKNNFELIELMIVIVVVGILCAMIFPTLERGRKKQEERKMGIQTEYNLKKAALQLVEIDSRLEKKYKVYYLDNEITEDEFKNMWELFISLNPSYSMDDYPFKEKKKEKHSQNEWLK